jgi:ATP synthase protein I
LRTCYGNDLGITRLINKENISIKKGLFPSLIIDTLKKLVLVSVVSAVTALVFFGMHAGISLLLGVVPVIVGLLVSAPIAYKSSDTKKASTIVISALKAEIVKILIIIFLLWLAFKFYEQIVPLANICGVIIAAVISGIGVTKLEIK